MHLVLRAEAGVGVEAALALLAAAEEGAEELVQVGQEHAVGPRVSTMECRGGEMRVCACVQVGRYVLLVGVGAVGRLALFERSSSTVIEEVDRDTRAASAVARGETAVEVREEVDRRAVDGSGGEDTGDGRACLGLGVCDTLDAWLFFIEAPRRLRTVANDDRVDDGRQQGLLVLGRVVHEQSDGVLVTEGRILGHDGADDGGRDHGLEKHACDLGGDRGDRGDWIQMDRDVMEARASEQTETADSECDDVKRERDGVGGAQHVGDGACDFIYEIDGRGTWKSLRSRW